VEVETLDDRRSSWISSRLSRVTVDTYRRDRLRRPKRPDSRLFEMPVPVLELVEE
jgi:hypothetical protein